MPNFNPDATATAGLQLRPDGRSAARIDSGDRALAVRVPSTATETIDTLHLPAWVHTPGRFVIDVYEAGDEVGPDEPDVATYRPNAGAYNNSNRWVRETGSAATVYQSFDETVLQDTDWATPTQNKYEYEFEVASAGFPSGVVVVGGDVVIRAATAKDTAVLQVYISPIGQNGRLIANGAKALGSVIITDVGSAGVQELRVPFPPINPQGNLPWDAASIRSFDAGRNIGFYTSMGYSNSPSVHQVYLEVRYIPDLRVASAMADVLPTLSGGAGSAQVSSWKTFQVIDAVGASTTWAKAAGVDYVYVLRRVKGPLGDEGDIETWRLGRTIGEGPPEGTDVAERQISLGADGYPVESFDLDSLLPVGVNLNAVATFSEDSQPYVTSPGVALDGTAVAESRLVTEAFANYQIVRALVGVDGASADVRDPITVNVTVNGVTAGATGSITVADWEALDEHSLYLPNARSGDMEPSHGDAIPVKLVEVVLSSAITLNPANDNRIKLSVPTVIVPADEPYWFVPTLSPVVQGAGSEPTVAAYADVAQAPTTISTRPAAPTGLAVVVAQHDLDAVGECAVASVSYASLTWTGTSLSAAFVRYEIQRSEDAGTTWQDVAYITNESVEEFRDYEAPRTVVCQWRIRVIRDDGIGSAWTATVTATLNPADCEWVFTSNEAPELTVAYDRDPEIVFDFDDSGVRAPLAGRDGKAVFRETEDRLNTFPVGLTVHFGGEPSTQPVLGRGRQAFDPLVDLCKAALSYVCVADPYGNRWLADVWCDKAPWREPAARYSATVTVDEMTREPSTPDVAP